MSKYYYLGIAFVTVCGSMLGGCGGSGERAPVAQTTGVVKLNGAPVEGVKVTFLPTQNSSMFSHGTTDKDGKFTMSTYGMNDGALVGRHTVIVTKVEIQENKIDPKELSKTGYGGAGYKEMMGPGKKKQELKNEIPKKYTDAKTSGIEIAVELGQNNDVPINLTP